MREAGEADRADVDDSSVGAVVPGAVGTNDGRLPVNAEATPF